MCNQMLKNNEKIMTLFEEHGYDIFIENSSFLTLSKFIDTESHLF
jgi:hypothetical protein